LGSIIVPHMVKFLAREKERMAALDGSEAGSAGDPPSDEESAVEGVGQTLATGDMQGSGGQGAGATAATAAKAEPTKAAAVAIDDDSTKAIQ
jgi:hypothetical protein